MERPKSRGVFSFLRKKKKKSSPSFSSDFPFPLPHTAAVEKRDIDIALAGNHHARYDSSETFATSSQSSLTHGIQNLNIGVSDTGTGTQSEGYRGILTQPSYIRASRKEHGQSTTAKPPFSPIPGTSSPLLLLPAEIRNVIYEYVIGTPYIRMHTKVVAGDLTATGVMHSWETLSRDYDYRWPYEEPPKHTHSWFYHSGHDLYNVTKLWRICKQIYRESYTLALSRIIYRFGNHLVAQDFLARTHSDGTCPSVYITFLLSHTLREFENLPVEDLRRFVALKTVSIQCHEKAAWEWAIWDQMLKEKRDAEREKEKQIARERVCERVQEAFPDRIIEIRIGYPPIGLVNEKTLALEWDGGMTQGS